jgi:hypothetical protein
MHTVDLLDQALALARRAGFRIRQEWLGGGGGGCELRGQKVLFLDVAQGPAEQLDQVLDALRCSPELANLPMADPLREMLGIRKSA